MGVILFVYFTVFPIAVIWYLYKISETCKKMQEKQEKMEKKQPETDIKTKRIHNSIAKSDFENAFGGRKAYEIYQNQDGLYEPIMPSKGIELKKKEE